MEKRGGERKNGREGLIVKQGIGRTDGITAHQEPRLCPAAAASRPRTPIPLQLGQPQHTAHGNAARRAFITSLLPRALQTAAGRCASWPFNRRGFWTCRLLVATA